MSRLRRIRREGRRQPVVVLPQVRVVGIMTRLKLIAAVAIIAPVALTYLAACWLDRKLQDMERRIL